MPTSVAVSQYILGPADVFYRAVGVLTPWTNVGGTLDDAVARITTERFTPDNLAGVMGPVMGLDVIRKCNAEIEFTIPEIAGTKLGLVIPGVRTTAATGANAGGSPFSSTTTAIALAGATSIPVVAVTNAAVGDYIKIGTGTTVEYRVITSITSLVIGFRDPLLFDHALGEAAVETVDDNRAIIQAPIVRRQPDTAYREWALVVMNGNAPQELRLPRAFPVVDSVEITVGDSTLAGVRVTLQGRLDPTNLNTSPFNLYSPN